MSNRSVAIIQPYFYPYLGYFQLLSSVDEVVFLDDAQYVDRSWINRNRIANAVGQIEWLTVPLEKGSSRAAISERKVSTNFDLSKLVEKIKYHYEERPFGQITSTFIKTALADASGPLSNFLITTLLETHELLGLELHSRLSSEVPNPKGLRGEERIIDICVRLNATNYLNPEGGKQIYSPLAFEKADIKLEFLIHQPEAYDQGYVNFNERLSILDALANISREEISHSIRNDFKIESFEPGSP